MSFTDAEIEVIEHAHVLVNKVLRVLEEHGCDPDEFEHYRKIYNITRSRDPLGMRCVQSHMGDEARVIMETGLWNYLGEAFDEAHDELSDFTFKHKVFSRG